MAPPASSAGTVAAQVDVTQEAPVADVVMSVMRGVPDRESMQQTVERDNFQQKFMSPPHLDEDCDKSSGYPKCVIVLIVKLSICKPIPDEPDDESCLSFCPT